MTRPASIYLTDSTGRRRSLAAWAQRFEPIGIHYHQMYRWRKLNPNGIALMLAVLERRLAKHKRQQIAEAHHGAHVS